MRRMVVTVMGGIMAIVFTLAGTAWSADEPEVYGKKCKMCHSIAGVAGPMAKMGGPLDGVGSKHDEAWLRAYLKDPKSKMPEAKMPAPKLTDEEFNQLINYMLSLK